MPRPTPLVPTLTALATAALASEPPSSTLERGAYVADRVALCVTCHSQRDWTAYSGPVVPGAEAAGGSFGLFGSTTATPPVRPADLARWSAEELAERLRDPGSGIHTTGGLEGLRALTAEDALAVAHAARAGFPSPPTGWAGLAASSPGAQSDSVEIGRYLVTVARCVYCHGEDLSGGPTPELPSGPSLPVSNLTTHPDGVAGRLSRDEFVAYFKSLDDPELAVLPVPDGQLNTAMPWPWLATLAEGDLGAIYDYLVSLPPVATWTLD